MRYLPVCLVIRQQDDSPRFTEISPNLGIAISFFIMKRANIKEQLRTIQKLGRKQGHKVGYSHSLVKTPKWNNKETAEALRNILRNGGIRNKAVIKSSGVTATFLLILLTYSKWCSKLLILLYIYIAQADSFVVTARYQTTYSQVQMSLSEVA